MSANSLYEDQELLSLLRKDDERAFAQLYEKYSGQLFTNLLKLLKSEQWAAEVLQDIFVQLWEKRATIDIQSSFQAYLLRIGVNRIYDHYRKVSRDKSLYAQLRAAVANQYVIEEENIFSEQHVVLLREAIRQLPPQRRQVFEYCKLEGRSYKEVSELLGISLSTINDHIVKATRSVREYMQTHREFALALVIVLALKELS